MEARRRRLGMRLSGANAEQTAFRHEALQRSKEELGQSWRGDTRENMPHLHGTQMALYMIQHITTLIGIPSLRECPGGGRQPERRMSSPPHWPDPGRSDLTSQCRSSEQSTHSESSVAVGGIW